MARYPVGADGKLISIVIDGDLPVDAAAEADGPPADGAHDRWNGSVWLRDQAVVAAERKVGIIAQIAAIEARQHRALRENALGQSGAAARLQSLDSEIAALRAQL